MSFTYVSRSAWRNFEQERKLSALPPVVIGGALVVPEGLVARLKGEPVPSPAELARETERVEKLAMEAVMAAERELGFEQRDVSAEKRGYDVESKVPEPAVRDSSRSRAAPWVQML
jgi:hypothetical protein